MLWYRVNKNKINLKASLQKAFSLVKDAYKSSNIKIIQRTNEVRVLMSDQEKELVWKYAQTLGISVSKLIRDLVLNEAKLHRR